MWIWGGIHQLGYAWHDADRGVTRWFPTRAGGALTMGIIGYGALVLLTQWGGYPVSMVGVDGAARSNNSPPSIALVALALGQIGLALACRAPAERLLARPRAWAAVVAVGAGTMTIFLWHQTAMIAVAAALIPTGVWPNREVIDLGWWAQRPLWWLACTVGLVALVGLFARFERADRPRQRASRIRAAIGVTMATAGLGLLVFGGLHRPGTATGVPWIPLGLAVVGCGALGVLRRPDPQHRLPAPGGAAEPAEIAPPESAGANAPS